MRSRVTTHDWGWARIWTLAPTYALLSLIAVLSVAAFVEMVIDDVRVETRTLTEQVAPDTYEGFEKAYGPGQQLAAADLQALGVPSGTVCASWNFPTGYAVLCKA